MNEQAEKSRKTQAMNKEYFLEFVDHPEWWHFAKSIPNWPHFYIVEKELPDQSAFHAAKSFIRESGYAGKFFDMEVNYFDADGWTYWASPLAKPHESQYMLNRCKTEYTYQSLARTNNLPPEGFRGSELSLAPVLGDSDFESLVRETEGAEFTVFDALGNSEYEIRHSNVLAWLLNPNGNHRQGSSFLDLFWTRISSEHNLPDLSFRDYSVAREGENEKERIDLFIKAEKWVIVIENKLFAPETGDQLNRYFNYIERKYANTPNRLYFYLTPDGIAPDRDEDSKYWKAINYSVVTDSVSLFLKKCLPDRVKGFLEQYLEHIEKNVLSSAGSIEKQKSVLKRHAKTFHSLEYLLKEVKEEYVENHIEKCSKVQFDLLKSILAVQKAVSQELFTFTKQMIPKHGYSRHSGQGHWVTIVPPELRKLQFGLESKEGWLPVVFAFDSRPDSYSVEIWIFKKSAFYSKYRSHVSQFLVKELGPNRGDDHLVAVLFREVIINADEIIRGSLAELKNKIATYFASDLKKHLNESVTKVGDMLASIAPHEPR